VKDNLRLEAQSHRDADLARDLGRALTVKVRLLLLDGSSIEFAVNLVDQAPSVIRALTGDGPTILLVEQNACSARKPATVPPCWRLAASR
jgi:ABC-type branched-subunit amino acid transport system ATPase component